MSEQRRVVVGVTGAGGTRLAGVLLNTLVDDERVGHVDVMVSANGRKLVAFEQGADEAADHRAPCRCSTRRIRWNTAPSSPTTGSRTRSPSRAARCCTRPD
jgi:3-polyprenyl-4-hydroxybenzoate decarboxylase